ncbi:hypothetical protein ACJWVF_26000, partial [Klebsiella pneumoniae]
SDGNGSHASTLKSPSYTKSVSWQHYRFFHLSDSIHNRLRAISPDLHVHCDSYLFLPVIHTVLKTGDLKKLFLLISCNLFRNLHR